MPARTKTLMRQRTYIRTAMEHTKNTNVPQEEDGIASAGGVGEDGILQSAVHLRFVKTNKSLFLASEIRVLFPHRAHDVDERARTAYESTPYTPLTRQDRDTYTRAKKWGKLRHHAT